MTGLALILEDQQLNKTIIIMTLKKTVHDQLFEVEDKFYDPCPLSNIS
jgi:hypothetical protein